ncbi:hypothetical protein F5884DRAFT_894771 [Xylogone sp. PMI_703]|nr:hypothetical protein F5884DRAFT_894771 [Xylogone sp. PMI_703]
MPSLGLSIVRLLLGSISLSSLVKCTSTSEGFIFPPDEGPSDLTAHIGDHIIVEYTKLPYTMAVGIDIACFDTEEDAIQNATSTDNWGPRGPYNNTGKVQYDFDLKLNASLSFCLFALFNDSITSCAWGPWGVSVIETTNYYIPLFYSAVFRVFPERNGTKPVEWINGQDPTTLASSAAVTATASINVTCPPSGIPAQPTAITRQVDIWPPVAGNLKFPAVPGGL